MDILGLVGVVFGLVVIVLGNMAEGGLIGALINGPAALIVFGGTLAAVLVQTPFFILKPSLKKLLWLVFPPKLALDVLLNQLCIWAALARKDGLIILEKHVDQGNSTLAKKGLNLLADGQPVQAIRASLELDIYKQEERGLQAVHVYESLGGYAPTIGILGAILGLMHALMGLNDPTTIGPNIATAFVATIYGVGSANLLFLPLAARIKFWVQQEYVYNQLLLEGLLAIAEGEHPDSIRYRYEVIKHA